jgi:hypothetical protein
MNAAKKLEKNSMYGRVNNVHAKQNSPSTADPSVIVPSTTRPNGCPGALLTSDARSFVLDELKHGVTAIEVTPIGIIRHYDKRSAYPLEDLPIPYTLTEKAREYFAKKAP